ncbi:hypothetical protein N802_05665 [Knoellia sinensis KCTC 19936]|uniref:Integral membrane bound transporter domain-containing protein n=1 Tax=Knoellia sinensis KCTC 19936 TaxID=1385520 RepID=A0A0A0J1A2_9MICO|nr:hypothetical protein N802_05665 [Knoellia sinensis KCTC 19936]
MQATVAATTAWVIARQLIDDHIPFFAPIAAVVALNASRGERGLNAVRVVLGVFVGIVAGEAAVAVLGGGVASLVAALLAALAAARLLASATVVLNQAAVAAILTVVAADGQAGPQRLVDALVGAVVALVFTQVLFSPEPVGMLRRAQGQALAGIGSALDHTAHLLDRVESGEVDEANVAGLSPIEVPAAVVDLAKVRRATDRTVRRSAVWQRQRGAVEHEQLRAATIDLLSASSLMLCRVTVALPTPDREPFAHLIGRLGGALGRLAADPADHEARQRAADEALTAVHEVVDNADDGEHERGAALAAARITVGDLLAVVGVEPDDAARAIESGRDTVVVENVPPAPRFPIRLSRRHRRHW